MKKIGLLLCCTLVLSEAIAHKAATTLTDSAHISILTCSPGPDLYSLFGHTAIRVEDHALQPPLDLVFNYGTFDFNDESFYMKFATGKLPYKLAVSDFGNFQYEYIVTGRSISAQLLLLTPDETQQLWNLLVINQQPENCYYKYDFFYDNCCTRVRDIVRKAAHNHDITYNYKYTRTCTYRQAIQRYLDYQPWSDFGIDLALGMPCDAVIGNEGFMFLPDSLMNEIDYANHEGRRLAMPVVEILPAEFDWKISKWFSPILVFVLFLLVHVPVGLLLAKRKERVIQCTDRLIFFVTGIVGLLIVFLWFFTDHTATHNNLNILWANPLTLLLAFVRNGATGRWIRIFLSIYLAVLMLTTATWFFLPQQLHLAVIPIMVALIFSCWKMLRPQTFVQQKQPTA
ncbi:MAG: DUF4105 domain-containing protein [Flavobacteriales bacterium]